MLQLLAVEDVQEHVISLDLPEGAVVLVEEFAHAWTRSKDEGKGRVGEGSGTGELIAAEEKNERQDQADKEAR